MRRRGAPALALGCALVLGGCTSAHEPPPEGGGFHLAQIGVGSAGTPSRLQVARIEHPPANDHDWTVGGVDPSSAWLEIAWTDGGSPECGQVDRVRVHETATSVAIGLAATHRGEQLCDAIGYPRRLTVHLRAPLGGRGLVEGTTGIDDGLPTTASADAVADPRCADPGDGEPRDVPVGMPDATRSLAPGEVDSVLVCRTAWPKGSAHTFAARVSGGAVASLVAVLNGSPDLEPADTAKDRCEQHHGTWDAVYLVGHGVRVEVRVDDFACTVTNGAVTGSTSPAITRALDALFPATAR